MNDNIEKIMEEFVANGANRIIINPETLKLIEKQGIPFDVIPSPTIGELFDQRKENAYTISNSLPNLPEALPPTIQALYQEIRECIFFGLNGAAITMSSILIEYVLKHTTFITEAGGYKKALPKNWEEFENIELSPAINRAKKAGILDSKMAKRLHSFRTTIRNVYSHYNIAKITENIVAEKVQRLDVATGEVKEITIFAKDSPVIQAQAKPLVDQHNVLPVFHFADEVVKYLLPKINKNM